MFGRTVLEVPHGWDGYAVDPWGELVPGPLPFETAQDLLWRYQNQVRAGESGRGLPIAPPLVASQGALPVGAAGTLPPAQQTAGLSAMSGGISLTTAALIVLAFILLGMSGKRAR